VPPEQDPQVRAAILADYREAPRQIERKARVMGFDRGRRFRRGSYDALPARLAEAYGLSENQVRRIIGR
jgi:hypothetical protein